MIVRDSEWRAMAAIQAFRLEQQDSPHFDTWLRRAKPLARLKSLREILALDASAAAHGSLLSSELRGSAGSRTSDAACSGCRVEPGGDRPEPPIAPQPVRSDCRKASQISDEHVLVGDTRNRAVQSVRLARKGLTKHTAFLGSTGSGKTTAALNIIEQLLMRGIPALLGRSQRRSC